MSYRSFLLLVTGGFALIIVVLVSLYAGLLNRAFEIDMEINALTTLSSDLFSNATPSATSLIDRYEESFRTLNSRLEESFLMRALFLRGFKDEVEEVLERVKNFKDSDDYRRALEYLTAEIQKISSDYFGVQWRLTLAFLVTVVILVLVYVLVVYRIGVSYKKQLSKLLLGIKALEHHDYGYLINVDEKDFLEIRWLIQGFNMLSTAIKNADNILFGVLKQMGENGEKKDR
ncbi:MAG: hypothetical protein PWP09_524 [Thermotogota bacterium]|nr:hypothetical protein [Thermotogota bacterium]